MREERKQDCELRMMFLSLALESIVREWGDTVSIMSVKHDDGVVRPFICVHNGDFVASAHSLEEITGVFDRAEKGETNE